MAGSGREYSVVKEFLTNHRRIAPALGLLRTPIDRGELVHDAHPALERHVANARSRATSYGTTVRKETRDSSRKIDLLVASALAMQATRLGVAAGPARRPPGRLITF